jgi:hypothetical protein
MALVVPAQQGELIRIGEIFAYFAVRSSGKVRLVIEGMSYEDIVRVAGVDVQIKRAGSDQRVKMHATGPREIPIRALGILTDPDLEMETQHGPRELPIRSLGTLAPDDGPPSWPKPIDAGGGP